MRLDNRCLGCNESTEEESCLNDTPSTVEDKEMLESWLPRCRVDKQGSMWFPVCAPCQEALEANRHMDQLGPIAQRGIA
jgi:hypothetical protein